MHVCVFVSVSDLGVVRVLERQAKVVPLQQVQMATHHVQQGLALGKFLLHTQTHRHTCIEPYKNTQQTDRSRFYERHVL